MRMLDTVHLAGSAFAELREQHPADISRHYPRVTFKPGIESPCHEPHGSVEKSWVGVWCPEVGAIVKPMERFVTHSDGTLEKGVPRSVKPIASWCVDSLMQVEHASLPCQLPH